MALEIPEQENIAVEKSKSKTGRSVIYTLVVVAITIALSGFLLSGGILPNVNKSTPNEFSDSGTISGYVSGPLGLPAVGTSVIVYKIQGLPGTYQSSPDYTANSIISIDGKFMFNLPPGVYRIVVAFPDGTNHIESAYAVWPRSSLELDF